MNSIHYSFWSWRHKSVTFTSGWHLEIIYSELGGSLWKCFQSCWHQSPYTCNNAVGGEANIELVAKQGDAMCDALPSPYSCHTRCRFEAVGVEATTTRGRGWGWKIENFDWNVHASMLDLVLFQEDENFTREFCTVYYFFFFNMVCIFSVVY